MCLHVLEPARATASRLVGGVDARVVVPSATRRAQCGLWPRSIRADRGSEVSRGYEIGRRAKDMAVVARYPRVVLSAGRWSAEALECVHGHGAFALHALVLVDSSVGEDPPPPGGGGFIAELKHDRAAALERFVRGMFRSPRPEAEVRALRDQALRMPLAASLSLFPSSVPREHWRRIARGIPVPLLYVVTPQLAGQAENLRRARPATRVEVSRKRATPCSRMIRSGSIGCSNPCLPLQRTANRRAPPDSLRRSTPRDLSPLPAAGQR